VLHSPIVFAIIPDMPPAIRSLAKLSLIGTGAFGLACVDGAVCGLFTTVVWVAGALVVLVAVMTTMGRLGGNVNRRQLKSFAAAVLLLNLRNALIDSQETIDVLTRHNSAEKYDEFRSAHSNGAGIQVTEY